MCAVSRGVDGDWIAAHRRVWDRKAGLRAVYAGWFRRVRDRCTGDGPIVEIGCGPAFFKRAYPDIIATDVAANPFADLLVDAAELPFATAAVGNVIMIDVFHHIADPPRFLGEVARVLRPGGRLVMLEPWISVAGRFLWTHVHHEGCDLSVCPGSPWNAIGKDPMEGNAALPYLYFCENGYLGGMRSPLRVLAREPFAGISWLLSGGFQALSLLPPRAAGLAEWADRVLSRAPRWTATRCLVTVAKTR